MMKRNDTVSLHKQMQLKNKSDKEKLEDEEIYDGNFSKMTSTGSTLLDLAISDKRVRGGGIQSGVLVEIFGPSQSGKTALMVEIAGNIKRKGGKAKFYDPEARLDAEFARLFGTKIEKENYSQPDTVTELFGDVRKWEPKTNEGIVNGIFADSLTALSTEMEMENSEGDKMGGRRAKEFSEELRKTCRLIKQKDYIMVASNQIRQVMNAMPGQKRTNTSGGEAVKFYSTIRLEFSTPKKLYAEIIYNGNKIKNVIGIETEIEVIKTACTPYRKVPLIILYGYGIDDIRANLQYIKEMKGLNYYSVDGQKLEQSMEKSIRIVEDDVELIKDLRNEVIDLWEEIENKFSTDRVKKRL